MFSKLGLKRLTVFAIQPGNNAKRGMDRTICHITSARKSRQLASHDLAAKTALEFVSKKQSNKECGQFRSGMKRSNSYNEKSTKNISKLSTYIANQPAASPAHLTMTVTDKLLQHYKSNRLIEMTGSCCIEKRRKYLYTRFISLCSLNSLPKRRNKTLDR